MAKELKAPMKKKTNTPPKLVSGLRTWFLRLFERGGANLNCGKLNCAQSRYLHHVSDKQYHQVHKFGEIHGDDYDGGYDVDVDGFDLC